MADPRAPVIIGIAQQTHRSAPDPALTPLAMLEAAARAALVDAGLDNAALIDAIGVVGFAIDAPGWLSELPVPRLADPPASLAARLGARAGPRLYTHMGGDNPIALLGEMARRVVAGEAELALIAGAEFIGNLMRLMQSGGDLSRFADPAFPERLCARFGDPRPGSSPLEDRYGLALPAHTYPLFEIAWRARRGLSPQAHLHGMAATFAKLSAVAAGDPLAWFGRPYSPDEIATISPDNRMIAFPYPKRLNAFIQCDMAAALLVTTRQRALELGVSPDKCAHIAGLATAREPWFLSERVDYAQCPAIARAGAAALAQAELDLSAIDRFDIYSCFPSAVALACDALGLAMDDPRGLTLTGGLPFFGGPGNNYAMHALTRLVEQLRRGNARSGLVTANGWHLTKHAIAVLSAAAPAAAWRAPILRADAPEKSPVFIEAADGPARIETYTIVHDRKGPDFAILIGRDSADRRFLAQSGDPALMDWLQRVDGVGALGRVQQSPDGRNLFSLAEGSR